MSKRETARAIHSDIVRRVSYHAYPSGYTLDYDGSGTYSILKNGNFLFRADAQDVPTITTIYNAL